MSNQPDRPSQGGEREARPIERIVAELADEIYYNATNDRLRLRKLLIQFADEIKREAIEP